MPLHIVARPGTGFVSLVHSRPPCAVANHAVGLHLRRSWHFQFRDPPQSTIIAERPCRIVLIPATLWEKILTSHAPTMASYVVFLTQRIGFLNKKIQYLTAGSAERRLSLYLSSQIPEDNTPTRLNISAVSLADLLDLGRASLYRALDKLTSDGFLIREGHTYTLCNREAMLSYYS